jgi:hypothetical protein
MVVRRIREHLVAHSWFAVCIDLLVVVVGVFIGMQVTNWNNRRIEHHQSLSYRSRLIDELDFNARQFAQQVAYYEQVRSHALATMRALESRSGESSDFFVHAYQSTQIDITPPKRFIYDEMVSSGLVERLGSTKVQAQASDYYLNNKASEDTYNVIPPYRALMRTLIPHLAQAQIRGRCGDIVVTHEGRIIGSRLPESCDVSVDPAAIATGVVSIRREPRLHDELNRYLSWINEKVGNLKERAELTNSLRQALIEQS